MKHNLGVKEETKNKRMMIFSGSSCPELAQKIADNLHIKMGDVSRTHFKDGEIYDRAVGMRPKPALKQWLDSAL